MTILDNSDCGAVASITVLFYPTPGSTTPVPADTCTTRRFVAYVQRVDAPAWQVLLCEDLGDALGPPLGSFPGPKEGDFSLEADIGGIWVYYTGRLPGDPSGPFRLQRERVAVADIWPLDLVGVLRVRNISRILEAHLSATARELGPYVK